MGIPICVLGSEFILVKVLSNSKTTIWITPKQDLLCHKQELGDTDSAYPEMMEINRSYW